MGKGCGKFDWATLGAPGGTFPRLSLSRAFHFETGAWKIDLVMAKTLPGEISLCTGENLMPASETPELYPNPPPHLCQTVQRRINLLEGVYDWY